MVDDLSLLVGLLVDFEFASFEFDLHLIEGIVSGHGRAAIYVGRSTVFRGLEKHVHGSFLLLKRFFLFEHVFFHLLSSVVVGLKRGPCWQNLVGVLIFVFLNFMLFLHRLVLNILHILFCDRDPAFFFLAQRLKFINIYPAVDLYIARLSNVKLFKMLERVDEDLLVEVFFDQTENVLKQGENLFLRRVSLAFTSIGRVFDDLIVLTDY